LFVIVRLRRNWSKQDTSVGDDATDSAPAVDVVQASSIHATGCCCAGSHKSTTQAGPECFATGTIVEETNGEATNGDKEDN